MITCRREERDGIAIVSPVGSLDESNLESLQRALAESSGQDTVLDLSRVAYMNSQVLSLAVYSWRDATRRGRRFVLAGPSDPVRQIIEATGLDKILPLADTVEEVVEERRDAEAASASRDAGIPSFASAARSLTPDDMPQLFHIRQRLQDLAASGLAAARAQVVGDSLELLDVVLFERPRDAEKRLAEFIARLELLDAMAADPSLEPPVPSGTQAPVGDAPASTGDAGPSANALASFVDAELLAEGVAEARDHLERAEELLLRLESTPGDRELLNDIFRGFHSIKGFAGFVGATSLAHLAHLAETILDHARNGHIHVAGMTADIILQSIDSLRRMLTALIEGTAWSESEVDRRVREYLEAHAVVHHAGTPRPIAPIRDPDGGAPGEPAPAVPVRPAVIEALERIAPAAADSGPRRDADSSIRVSVDRVDHMVNMVGELVIAQAMLHQDPEVLASQESNSALHRRVAEVAKITRELQDISMSLRMVPLAATFQRLARVVRDTSRRLGKEVRFETVGEETEIDRSMVEPVVDPLVHMIRNSLDHGLEPPPERAATGKAAEGLIRIAAEHEGGYVVIRIEDDGRGIDAEVIRRKAVEKGLIAADAAPTPEAALELLFLPGFSTAAAVTDLSGRGVGMDVVKTNIERIGGDVRIASEPGVGTTVTVRIPLTMAIIDGMLVRVGEVHYTIPLLAIRESFALEARQVTRTADGEEVARIRDRIYPVLRLHRFHGIAPRSERIEDGILIHLAYKGLEFCLLVDEIAGQHQAVVKPLSSYLGRVRGVTSCSIMGNGEISLILDFKTLAEAAFDKESRS